VRPGVASRVNFPVFIHLGPWRLHPHLVFDILAYTCGFQVYLWLRRRQGDSLANLTRWSIVAAAFVGAAVGSRMLVWLEVPALIPQHWRDPQFLLGGKTIVGGLVGGLIAVEATKQWIGVKTATGDLFAIPLAVGTAIGRVGCFLTGLSDGTYGNPTTLWTGIDFGDGVARHPTQLYESAFLLLLVPALVAVRRLSPVVGDQFRVFMVSYFAFRLIVDLIKGEPTLALGLSAIQWACIVMLTYYFPAVRRWTRTWHVVTADAPRARLHGR
jgi:phosphatidylglycerol:prolipoprotein diacylglycerol transferase